MKRKIKVVIIVNPVRIVPLYRTMVLAFGKENVVASCKPEELFGLLKRVRPTTLILEPELFDSCGIGPNDINAYRRDIRYQILTVYYSETALELEEAYRELRARKAYYRPEEYLTMAIELPKLSVGTYVKRKEPLQKKTEENIERILRKCGFQDGAKGRPFLKDALYMLYFDPSLHNRGASKIYRSLAEKHDTTPRIVERAILRFLENSWSPQTERALRKELNVAEHHSFIPLNFGRFTEIFNTYYTIKYGDPEKILKRR